MPTTKPESAVSDLRFLQMLSRQYPTVQAASSEIINLQAILNLPKGTEHFLSDLHGEHEAFVHILNNASGAVREKVDILFENTLSREERKQLATLVYYPEDKLNELAGMLPDADEWYRLTLHRLIDLCRLVTSKYSRSKVRKALPQDYAYILDELLNVNYEISSKKEYYENIISTIIQIDQAEDFIIALCEVIKYMVVDHLHIVGDIFDRGPRADVILDLLMRHHSVDIQWGNHDVLWMGAATGSRTCIATVLNNSITYNNLEVIEMGYGISLRPLALFANEFYGAADCSCFAAKMLDATTFNAKDLALAARMHKAIAVILFKLEGQMVLRNPQFGMEDRLLLDKIDYQRKTVRTGGREYALKDIDFPTVDPLHPYELSGEEALLMEQLSAAFRKSEKLQRHTRFLYSNGSLYKCYNGNLLYHGCIPMREDGAFQTFSIGCDELGGKAFMDYADALARQGYYAKSGSREKQFGRDFLWFLWCGRNSPLFGRDHISTFERALIGDSAAWVETKNPYYHFYTDAQVCVRILGEFGLEGPHSHIINGHVPVKSKDGENPVKAGGRLVVIDGGFCRAYQKTTGIAGYTLIYNSWGMRLASHQPFAGKNTALRENSDIISTAVVFERLESQIKIEETDIGEELKRTVEDLRRLLNAYRMGKIQETHEK